MPMWAPPTPPQDDNDLYIDASLCFLYEPSLMTESQLPPVHVKKQLKRVRVDPAIPRHKQKVRKEEQARIPRSLFDRPMSALRRDAKLVKMKHGLVKPLRPTQPLATVNRTMASDAGTSNDHADWMIHEDWALLQAVQMLLDLPLNLMTTSPAHIPNWDLVAEVVNGSSRTYRSAKQCKNRYEQVIVPREEGRILYDINPRKQKKSKGIYKTKNNRPMRTSQLHLQDSDGSVSALHALHFDACRLIAGSRAPPRRPALSNPTLRNPKHAVVLAENGIAYDQPLTPIQVATIRADRIAKEKKQSQLAAEQQLAAQRTQQLATASASNATVSAGAVHGGSATATAAVVSQLAIVQDQAGQAVITAAPAPNNTILTGQVQKGTVTLATAARSLTGSIVVNSAGTVTANTFATINKRIGQTVIGTSPRVATSGSLVQATRVTPSTKQTEHLTAAVVNTGQARLGTQVITTTTLAPAQLVTAQKTGTFPQATKALTAQQLQQLQLIRQQQQTAILKQQELQRQARFRPLDPQQQQQVQQVKQAQHVQVAQQQQLKLLQVQSSQQQQLLTTVAASGNGKTVTAPLITNISPAQLAQARLQVPKQTIKAPAVTRNMTDVAVLLKRKQLQQQQQIQQQQQQQKLTTAQIIASTQGVQQQLAVSGGNSTTTTTSGGATGLTVSSQPVVSATLVKTSATPGGATSVPSVTIPMSAVSFGTISVSVPQQKTVVGKTMTPQQMRQLQLLHQRKPTTAIQLQQSKVASLTGQMPQVAKVVQSGATSTPLIIQQQQAPLGKAMVQQLQNLIKQQQQQAAAAAASGGGAQQSSSAAVLTGQLVSQAPVMVQAVGKLSAVSAALSQVVSAKSITPIMVTAVAGSNAVTTSGVSPQKVSSGAVVAASKANTLALRQVVGQPLTQSMAQAVVRQQGLAGLQQQFLVKSATVQPRLQTQQQALRAQQAATLRQQVSVQQLAVKQAGVRAVGSTVVSKPTAVSLRQTSPQQQPILHQASPTVAVQQALTKQSIHQVVQHAVQQAQARQLAVSTVQGSVTSQPSQSPSVTTVTTPITPVTIQMTPVTSRVTSVTPQVMSVTPLVTTVMPLVTTVTPQTVPVTLQGTSVTPQVTPQTTPVSQVTSVQTISQQQQNASKASPYAMRLRNQKS